jgi:hypothetical protein
VVRAQPRWPQHQRRNRRLIGTSPVRDDNHQGKEGTMNAEIWIELAIVLLRILAAGISG